MKQHLATLTTCLLLCAQAIAADSAKPNIILILSDDQGFTDYGFIGHKVVQTPNLDRMASQSPAGQGPLTSGPKGIELSTSNPTRWRNMI